MWLHSLRNKYNKNDYFLMIFVMHFLKPFRERNKEKVSSPQYNTVALNNDSDKTQSGGLQERHKARLSWPSIVRNDNNINKQCSARCKVHRCAQFSDTTLCCR